MSTSGPAHLQKKRLNDGVDTHEACWRQFEQRDASVFSCHAGVSDVAQGFGRRTIGCLSSRIQGHPVWARISGWGTTHRMEPRNIERHKENAYLEEKHGCDCMTPQNDIIDPA